LLSLLNGKVRVFGGVKRFFHASRIILSPRDPSSHAFPIVIILLAEQVAQVRFLIKNNKQMNSDKITSRIPYQ